MVNSLNIMSAAIIIQFSICAIMFIGAWTLYWGKDPFVLSNQRETDFSKLSRIIIPFFLLTIGCLLLSDEFSKLYNPLFGNAYLTLLRWSVALVIVYTLNVACAAILVGKTGGSRTSPFSPFSRSWRSKSTNRFASERMSRIVMPG